MKTLSIKTQNKSGNAPQFKENIGYVTAFLRHSEDRIVIDDFEGEGVTYKQRECTEIKIVENGKTLFQGTKFELFEKLKS